MSARTAELLEANTQLESEVAERRRAEEILEVHLRYEQTLTLCANTLLVGGDTQGVTTATLQYLIEAVNVSRVFLWENIEHKTAGQSLKLRTQVNALMVPPISKALDFFSHHTLGGLAELSLARQTRDRPNHSIG